MQEVGHAQNPGPAVTLHRLSVAQYDAMARAGILGPDDRVELLEGWLVEKMTKNPPHRIATRLTRLALEAVCPEDCYVEVQEPIVTADSEPEPDVAVIRGRTQDYATHNPPASAVALVVEVADVSLERDRALKGRIYARARVPVYWIVNLANRTVEVYTEPSGDGEDASYARRDDVLAGEELALRVDGTEVGRIAVSSLFA